jgi:Clostridial hydrophobic W
MSEANAASSTKAPAQKVIMELKVSGHLMTLDNGLYCIVQTPSRASDAATGFPGVRISLPPGPASRPEAVSITTFRPDGWLAGGGDAALVRVVGGPAHVLVTIYQSPAAKDGAPNLQVTRLLEPAAAGVPAPAAPAQPAHVPAATPERAPAVREMVAHIQERGDVGAMFGEWLGEKGSKRWVEGFGLAPVGPVTSKDIEYQAVLGRGWLSPWVEGGQFCGSRGMALPILGLRVRLKGEAAEKFELSYSATFIDGAAAGPVAEGEPCEAESLAAVEAFQIVLRPKSGAAMPADAQVPASAAKAKAAKPKPAADKPAKGKPPVGKPKK